MKVKVAQLEAEHGYRPGLAVVLVGENPASQVDVRNKIKACEEAGIRLDRKASSAKAPPRKSFLTSCAA